MKKVLIACPTALVKGYCFEDWLDNCLKFKYPNFEIRAFDNSEDGGKFTNYMNDYYGNKYGINTIFKAFNSMIINKISFAKKGSKRTYVRQKLALSHEDCRKYALDNNFDYLLHLESDVFPPPDVIERLISHQKNVCGALYYRDGGIYRSLMIQKRISKSPHNIISVNFEPHDDHGFIDGTLKKVSSVGLGCVLISRKVLKKIKFRLDKNQNVPPDSIWSEDCFRNRIPIFADTSIICKHKNQAWAFIDFD